MSLVVADALVLHRIENNAKKNSVSINDEELKGTLISFIKIKQGWSLLPMDENKSNILSIHFIIF